MLGILVPTSLFGTRLALPRSTFLAESLLMPNSFRVGGRLKSYFQRLESSTRSPASFSPITGWRKSIGCSIDPLCCTHLDGSGLRAVSSCSHHHRYEKATREASSPGKTTLESDPTDK